VGPPERRQRDARAKNENRSEHQDSGALRCAPSIPLSFSSNDKILTA